MPTAKTLIRLVKCPGRSVSAGRTCHFVGFVICCLPALAAQLDARPTGDQEVAGLTPAGSATFFLGDLIMKYFLPSYSAFC